MNKKILELNKPVSQILLKREKDIPKPKSCINKSRIFFAR